MSCSSKLDSNIVTLVFVTLLESNFGVHTAREIPVSIPNTEVKPGRGDYTAIAGN